MSVTVSAAIAAYNASNSVQAQVIADSAANMVAGIANLTTLKNASKITSLTITGPTTATVADITSILTLYPSLAKAAGATLAISGTSNVATLTQINAIATLYPSAALESGATLVATDSAANILAAGNNAALALATKVTLTGTTNSVTATQALSLSSKPGFSVASDATLTLTGTSNSVSIAEAIILAAIPRFSRASGATLEVKGSASELANPANAAAFSLATTRTTIPTASISQAFKNFAADSTIAAQNIEDTTTNILANIESLKVLVGAGNLDSLKISGAANTATLAQIASIRAVFPTLAMSAGAKLVITDTATNILNGDNSTALGLGTTVTLTGVNTGLSVAQADTLAAKLNFSVGAGATLSITDTASAILNLNSDGVKKGTAFTLTGLTNTVSVANSLKLAAKPGFSVPTGAALEVTGSASEILLATNAVGVAKATKVTLTGDNALSVANATLLVAKAGFNLAAGATLVVTDTAANLLSPTARNVLTQATTITVSGTANTITAAQAANFTDQKISVDTTGGATLVVADTAENILAGNSAGIGKATALSVTGTVNVSNAEAIAAKGKPLLVGTSLTISDTAANIVAAGDTAGVSDSDGVALASAFIVIGATSAADAASLAALNNFVLKAGTTLTVTDTAENLVDPDNAAGVGKANAFSITGAATAAEATTLVGKPNYALASGSSLTIVDSVTEILLPANATGVLKAASVKLDYDPTDPTANAATAVQATTLAGLKNFAANATNPLVVVDTPAAILLAANAAGVAKATSIKVMNTAGDDAIKAADFTSLSAKPNLTLDGANLEVKDTAANLLSGANAAALTKTGSLATKVTLIDPATGANTVTAAQAATLASMPDFDAVSAGLIVADTSANLLAPANADGIALATIVKLTGTANVVTLEQAHNLIDTLHVVTPLTNATLTISDTAANLLTTDVAKKADLAFATAVRLNGNSTNLTVASSANLVVGMSVTGANLPTGTTIAAIVDATHITLSESPTGAITGGTATAALKLTGAGSANTKTLTVASSTGLAVGMTITGTNIPDGTTIVSIDDSTHITLSAAPTGTITLGTASAATKQLSGLSGATGDAVVTVASSTGLSVGMAITGTNIANNTTITNINADGTHITLSAAPTGTITAGTATAALKLTGAGSANTKTLTVASSTGLSAGMTITGTNIPTGTTIASVVDATHITLSAAPTDTITSETASATRQITGASINSSTDTFTVADAALLKALPGFALNPGATLVVEDTAANLLPTLATSTDAADLAAKTAGIATATTVKLKDPSGATNTVSALEATTLAAKTGFTLGSAHLVISDTAANLILASNATGVAKATSFVLKGDTNTASAAQATAWKNKGLTFNDTDATHLSRLVVADTAANILLSSNSAGVGAATKVTLTGTANTVSAADAATLVAKTGFNVSSNAKLTVIGDKTALLALKAVAQQITGAASANNQTLTVASSTGLAAGMAITGTNIPAGTTIASIVNGTSITLSAAPTDTITGGTASAVAKQLSGVSGTAASATLTLASSAGLSVGMAITGTNIPAGTTIASVVNGTSITLSASPTATISGGTATAALPLTGVGSANTKILTVASSTGLAAGMAITGTNIPAGTTIASVVNGTSITLSAAPTGTITAGTAQTLSVTNTAIQSQASSFQLTGDNTATVAEAATLAALGTNKFSLATGATLIVSDSAANLLSTDVAKVAGIAAATTIKLYGPNTVTAADATLLAGKQNFARETGATLIIADTADNILSAANTKGVGFGTAFTLKDSSLINAANAKLLLAKPGFTIDTGASVYVSDTATNLLSLATLTPNILLNARTTVQLLGTANTVTAADATLLAGSTGFSFAPGATLTIEDTAANLMAGGNAAGVAKAATVKVIGNSAAISATQAKTLAALPNFTLNAGATLPVTDTSANLLDPLNKAGVDKAT